MLQAIVLPKAQNEPDNSSYELLHRQLGHTGYSLMNTASKAVTGMELGPELTNRPFCEPCTYGKQHQHHYREVVQQATK